jgi:hypothetical protein
MKIMSGIFALIVEKSCDKICIIEKNDLYLHPDKLNQLNNYNYVTEYVQSTRKTERI